MHDPAPVSKLLTELASFVPRLQMALLAAAPSNWQYRSRRNEWSLVELICHLRDVEREIHQLRFRALIAQDNAFIAGADPDRWTEERGYQHQNGERAMAEFAAARQETVLLLQDLSPEMWQRRGRHAFFGPTSMHELLSLVVQHDQAHWQQVQVALVPGF